MGFEKKCINHEELIKVYESYSKLADIIVNLKNIDEETYFAYKMLKGYTRYSWSYKFLPVLFFWKFNKIDEQFDKFVKNTSKLFEI